MGEDVKVDGMYMENLEEWIEEEDYVVTYKYISRNLKVHVNVAKQMLYNFVESRKSSGGKLGVVYLVSGLVSRKGGEDEANSGSCQKVVLVKEKDLEGVKTKFTEVLSEHIYSVQKSPENITMTSLFLADKSTPGHDFTAAAGLTSIKHKAAVPREAVMMPQVPKKEVKTEPAPVKKNEEKKELVKKATGIEAAFSKVSAKKPSPVKTEAAKKPAAAAKSGKASISSMFAKQSSKPKPVKTAAEEKENIVNQKIEEKATVKEEKTLDNREVESTKPLAQSRGKTNKAKARSKQDDSKKRKRIQVMSDSESEDDEVEVEKSPALEEEAPPVSALLESEEEEEIPATPKQETKTRPGRRRVRRLVDKTYMDSKGYMVTKKEYESASESDTEQPEKKPVKKVTPKKHEKVEAPVSKKPKLTGSGGKGQTGIMNFFKKK